jgi:hypothetical protein
MTMTEPDDEVWEDLRDHYSAKLQQLVTDTVDTCRRADMDLGDMVGLVLVPLLCESVLAARAARMDYDRFMVLCGGVYKGLQETIEQQKATRKPH